MDCTMSTCRHHKTFFMKDNDSNNNKYVWESFILCDLVTIILMENSILCNKLLIEILNNYSQTVLIGELNDEINYEIMGVNIVINNYKQALLLVN